MLRWHSVALAALASVLAWGGSATAQVVVRAPFVNVQVGPGGVFVQAPGVIVDVQKRPAPVLVGNPPPGGVVMPQQPLLPQGAVRPPTLKEFAETFRPAEGTHQAVVVHPITGQPATVQFTLPAGNPEVRVTSRKVEFDYGRSEVEVRFTSNGGVKVEYKD